MRGLPAGAAEGATTDATDTGRRSTCGPQGGRAAGVGQPAAKWAKAGYTSDSGGALSTVIYTNVTPYETRVAVREDGALVELMVERNRERSVVGSLFKGRISRVLPGMQAAFVDVGLERDAFLLRGRRGRNARGRGGRARRARSRHTADPGPAARGAGDPRADHPRAGFQQGPARHLARDDPRPLPRPDARQLPRRGVAAHHRPDRAGATAGAALRDPPHRRRDRAHRRARGASGPTFSPTSRCWSRCGGTSPTAPARSARRAWCTATWTWCCAPLATLPGRSSPSSGSTTPRATSGWWSSSTACSPS